MKNKMVNVKVDLKRGLKLSFASPRVYPDLLALVSGARSGQLPANILVIKIPLLHCKGSLQLIPYVLLLTPHHPVR